MRLLVLAPHPFYQERGTPIAVDLLLRTLSEFGHDVDVVVFHEGESRHYPGVRLHRIRGRKWLDGVRPGFSFKKLACDVALFRLAERLARERRPDAIHAVEESVFMALALKRQYGIPYVFDMDSSMPRQMAAKWKWLRRLLPAMLRCERAAIRGAQAVVAVCDALEDGAREQGASRVVLLRDVSLLTLQPQSPCVDPPLPAAEAGTVTLLYVGNLESYQGIELMVEAFARTVEACPRSRLVIVGGIESHIRAHRELAARLGIASRVVLAGPRPTGQMAALFREADILVSPRCSGENTPMKIYSYLESGKPILATRLPTHTQVLTDANARLADPTPDAMAAAMMELIRDPEARTRLGRAAARDAAERYSLEAYRRAVAEVYPPATVKAG